MNKKTLILVLSIVALLLISIGVYLFLSNRTNDVVINNPTTTSIVYRNTEFGFNFSLPNDWQGYSIIKDVWNGTILSGTSSQSGAKITIRNPKWTSSVHYEDLPILVFTIAQWDEYIKEKFSISAAPIQASELARNNKYVFALPPRWDFDYSQDFKQAQEIFFNKPIKAFNVDISLGDGAVI